MKNQSGQALLIAVFIGLLLLLAIPVVVFVNTTGVMHRIAATNRDKATAVAEEGIGYAQQLLAAQFPNSTAWIAALTATTLAGVNFPAECNAATDTIGADGSHFRLTCGTFKSNTCATCQPYEIYVKSTAYLPSPQGLKPTRAIQAYFSQKTVAATLPTGQTVPVALAAGTAPSSTGGVLEVVFGPIASWDSNLWKLDSYSDQWRRPRKFAAGGIQAIVPTPASPTYPRPKTAPAATDRKEYWTFTSPGFNPVIDLTTYQAKAKSSICPTVPTCTQTSDCAAYVGPPAPPVADNCYFPNVGNADTAVFGSGFSCTSSPCVIYVNGNASLGGGAVPFSGTIPANNSNAFIVDGTGLTPAPTLTLGAKSDPVVSQAISPIPPTASLDDPYSTCANAIPCNGTTDTPIDFQGFVYTTGNLAFGSATTWTIDGVVRVDGTTTLAINDILRIYYNDVVNHNILTGSFQIMIDSQTEVTAQ